ncbi:MAG: hypothetical protein GYB24_15765 [Rhodobacteraceae bacterium]|nr:hypothetical protein [Paracoccaceae bacterium]
MTEERKIPDRPEDLDSIRSGGLFDRMATNEAKQLASGKSSDELRIESEEAEAARTERFRNHFERLAIVTLYLVWFAIVVVGLIWLYHLIAPPSLPRLPVEQVNNIQAIVTGGVIAGIASGHMKKRLN